MILMPDEVPGLARLGPLIAVSGGFDPLHVGHVQYLREASKLRPRMPGMARLVVILNGDTFLTKKKGRPFMPLMERAEILDAIGCVKWVMPFEASDPNDMTVCEALERLRPALFAKGGDRSSPGSVPEWDLCQRLGIEVRFGVGGSDKVQSSSSLHGPLTTKKSFELDPDKMPVWHCTENDECGGAWASWTHDPCPNCGSASDFAGHSLGDTKPLPGDE